MTYKQFRSRIVNLSKLAHRAYWEGRSAAADWINRRIEAIRDEYPEFSDALERGY